MPETPALVELGPGTAFPMLPLEKSAYFNGVAVATGVGDIIITLSSNGTPFLTVNTTASIAKTLGLSLLKSVENMETMMGQKVLSFEEFVAKNNLAK
jgi:hypothetical protein